ncbi:hypothetical protein GPALN_006102 [Globodera pallida]|nr:hypothetical protein GPALN_006102 [Globodera pallida]
MQEMLFLTAVLILFCSSYCFLGSALDGGIESAEPVKTVDDEIKEMVDKFGNLISATTDMPHKFAIISSGIKPFVKLLPGVGALVALGLSKQFDPGSPEYKGITRLHKLAEQKFAKIERFVELKTHEQMLTSILSEYTTKVSQSIMSIEGIYRKVIDPDEDRSAFKDDFTHECLHGDTPRSALMQTTNHRSQQSTHQASSTTASTTIAQLPPEDLTTMPAFFGAKIARPTKRCANNDNTCKNTSIYFISSYLMLIKERPQKFV